MATGFTGGCMCGAIRYECSVEPLGMGICHCPVIVSKQQAVHLPLRYAIQTTREPIQLR